MWTVPTLWQKQLTYRKNLVLSGGFLLRKWNSSEPSSLQHVPRHTFLVPYTGAKGIHQDLGDWNSNFRLSIAEFPVVDKVTKRTLVLDIAKVFNVLGWFAPTTISMKILLQRIWKLKVDWDDPYPERFKTLEI